jgi:hypothetical protein
MPHSVDPEFLGELAGWVSGALQRVDAPR